MKALIVAFVTTAVFGTAPAHARKDCEELKREIAAKIDANGVKAYSLEILAADAATAGKIVGSCEGGSRRIAYQRHALDAGATLAAEEPK